MHWARCLVVSAPSSRLWEQSSLGEPSAEELTEQPLYREVARAVQEERVGQSICALDRGWRGESILRPAIKRHSCGISGMADRFTPRLAGTRRRLKPSGRPSQYLESIRDRNRERLDCF